MSFAKALATKYPRGVNFVAEADFFYPLPTKITDWYPTTKKPPVASAPKVDADAAVLQYVPLLEAPQPSGPYSLVIICRARANRTNYPETGTRIKID